MNNQTRTIIDFCDVIRDKSSLFCYSENAEAEKLVYLLAQELIIKDNLPLIKICWNENNLISDEDAENTASFHLFKNFTSSMIKIEKLLSTKKHLILVTDLSTLKQEKNNKPYIHFLSVLLRKCGEYDSTMLTIVNEDKIENKVKNDLIPFFNNKFILNGKRIRKIGDEIIDLRYKLKENVLHLEPCLQSDMNKIKEIFSLTPEEKEELDKIVGQSLEEYRTSI
jgi:hypothetical protein